MNAFIRDFQPQLVEAIEIENVCNFLRNNSIGEGNLKILHLNIRSISRNYDAFVCLLEQLGSDFDVIILTETHQINDEQLYSLEGYNLIYNNGYLNRCDGMIAYVKDYLQYKYNFVLIGPVKTIEIEITNLLSNRVVITGVYKSPTINRNEFNQHLTNYLQNKTFIRNHIITGDINIDLLSLKPENEEYKNILNSFGFTSFINSITRYESKTCLDHFWVKMQKLDNVDRPKSFILRHHITDHFPIALTIDIGKREMELPNRDMVKYINYENLRTDLHSQDWTSIYNTTDSNVAANNFVNTLTEQIAKHTTSVKRSNRKSGKQKWITKGLLEAINNKNNLYLETLKQPNNDELKKEYKKIRDMTNKATKRAKREYIQREINGSKNASKALWNCINNVCNNKTVNKGIHKLKLDSGIVLDDAKDIAEEFNEFFTSIGQNLAKDITLPDGQDENDEAHVEATIFLHPTTNAEVRETIIKLKKRKSPGIDGIKSEILQSMVDEITEPLVYIINLCFSTGTFPNILKTGVITPLHKGGSTEDIDNYRPIALISNIAKIIEKLFKLRVVSFLSRFDVLSENQYGFREKKSTEDAILKLTSYIYEAVDKSKPSMCIFVDLSKAFDTVNHEILLKKLQNYGIRGTAHDLIANYLTNRQQIVSISGTKSSRKSITCGVPQGTVLGPLLFILYVNGLLKMLLQGKVVSYADDTAIFYEAQTWQILKEIAETDFLKVINWFKFNKLSMNVKKTKYISFTPYAQTSPNIENLRVHPDIIIPRANSIKYLGIIVDQHLRWDQHTAELTKRIRFLISKFQYIKEFLGGRHLKILYLSLVQSQLSYGIGGWGGVRDTHIRSLEVVQKWILKIIFDKNKLFSSDQLFRDSETLDIRQLYCLNLLGSIDSGKISLEQASHSYITRSIKNNFVTVPKMEKSTCQRYFKYYAPKIYNILPGSIKDNLHRKRFRVEVRDWIQRTDRHIFHGVLNN